jgi:serine/threonine-protein kinase
VHRDLKPANLFLTTSPDGSPLVKVLDFGISKSPSVFARTLSPSITTVNASMGTPQYMSPEQARDAGKVDARSDVWALGAILYELLAGKPAFDADSVPALVMMIAIEEPTALESLRPDVPAPLAASVRRCLLKNRDDRFADVAELARTLEAFVPEEARPSVARIARILGHAASEAPPAVESPPSVPSGRPRTVIVSFAVAAAILVIGAIAPSKLSSPSFVTSSVVEHPPAEAARARQEPSATSSPTALAPVASTITSADDPVTARAADPGAPAAAVRTSPRAPARPLDHATDATKRAAARQPFTATRPRSSSAFARSLASEPGRLTFQSNVPAQVALDGRPLGSTPKSVTVAPGSHTVVFAHPELGQKEQAVTLGPGQDKTVNATFHPRATHEP